MSLPTEAITAMITAARHDLAEDLGLLTDAQWATPSLCAAWTVEDTVAHLTSAAKITTPRWMLSMLLAGFRADVHNRRRLREQRGATPAETLERFRVAMPSAAAPGGYAVAWLGEVVVHSQDIRRPLGLTRVPEQTALGAVAEFFATRNFAVNSKTVANGFRLEATDAAFAHGDGPLVRGSIEAVVMVLAGRRCYLDDLTGDGVPELRDRLAKRAG